MEVYVCVIMRDPYIPHFIEWINYHKKIGINKFIIYDNDSIEFIGKAIRDNNISDVIIKLMPGVQKQLEAYHDCISMFYKRDDLFIAFIDDDEYIFTDGIQISDKLEKYKNFDAIGLNWKFWGSSGEYRCDSVINSCLYSSDDKFQDNKHIKVIVKPNKVKSFITPHHVSVNDINKFVDTKCNVIDKPIINDCHLEDFYINHYYGRSLEDYELKIKKGKIDMVQRELYPRTIEYFDFINQNTKEYNTKMKKIMEKDLAYKEIEGWFDYETIFDIMLNHAKLNGGKIVECGAWMGKSSYYLVSEATKLGIKPFIVDTWGGTASEIDTAHKIALTTDIFDVFKKNLSKYDGKYTAIRKDGVLAAADFDDNSLDCVFIDMEHTYEAVKNDIEAWLPKVKKGGIIGGHDYVKGWDGVIAAVDEKFGRDILTSSGCWLYYKL